MGQVNDSVGRVTVAVTVEFEDVDAYQIAHHAKIVAYLERARLRLLAKLGFSLEASRLAPVLYELKVRFRKPAKMLDQLEVTASLKSVDEYQIGLEYRVRRGGEVIAKASSIIAFADLDEGTLRPIPAELHRALSAAAPRGEGVAPAEADRRKDRA